MARLNETLVYTIKRTLLKSEVKLNYTEIKTIQTSFR